MDGDLPMKRDVNICIHRETTRQLFIHPSVSESQTETCVWSRGQYKSRIIRHHQSIFGPSTGSLKEQVTRQWSFLGEFSSCSRRKCQTMSSSFQSRTPVCLVWTFQLVHTLDRSLLFDTSIHDEEPVISFFSQTIHWETTSWIKQWIVTKRRYQWPLSFQSSRFTPERPLSSSWCWVQKLINDHFERSRRKQHLRDVSEAVFEKAGVMAILDCWVWEGVSETSCFSFVPDGDE